MTAVICAIALTLVPAPDGCQRGGHARAASDPSRGGHALLVLEPTGPLRPWECIHRKEAAWDDDRDPYWGGLQMDRTFQRQYGSDMIRRYRGLANVWPIREQMVVAWRAVVGYAGIPARGYGPWPNTRLGCA